MTHPADRERPRRPLKFLDLFAGELGWSKIFAKRGHECLCVDIKRPREITAGCEYIEWDVMNMWATLGWIHFNNEFACVRSERIDAIVASSSCEQFSVHGMKHFHPNPPYPELGIKLFNHTRQLCEAAGVPYIMENVRAAQQFVGDAVHHCGSFYLWGNAVPPVLPSGITKGFRHTEMFAHDRTNRTEVSATIAPELANCVADYAERILEQRQTA